MGLPGAGEAFASEDFPAPFLCVLPAAAGDVLTTLTAPYFSRRMPGSNPGGGGANPSGAATFSPWTASIKVMPAALNGKNGEHYPGGLPVFACVAQSRERCASSAEVAGENPAGSTSFNDPIFPCVVQQQRHAAQNGGSAGAIPAAGTTFQGITHKEAKAVERPPPVGNRLDRARHDCGAGPLASAIYFKAA